MEVIELRGSIFLSFTANGMLSEMMNIYPPLKKGRGNISALSVEIEQLQTINSVADGVWSS